MTDPTTRRFSEQETTAIIARAARAQHAVEAVPQSGLSLAELQEVGRAAGLAPEHIASAAASLEVERAEPPSRLGLPARVRQTRVLSTPVSDAAWERMVALLRQHFGGPGHGGQVGRQREWTIRQHATSTSHGDEIHVMLAPHPLGAQITVELPKPHRGVAEALAAGGTMTAIAIGTVVTAFAMSALTAKLAIVGALLLLPGTALGGGSILEARRRARRNAEQFEALLDRLALIAHTARD